MMPNSVTHTESPCLIRLILVGFLAIAAVPASSAQETTADPSAPDPTREMVLSPAAIDRRACKRPVIVEDIPYTWDQSERGTEPAWLAYTNGDYAASVPVFLRLAKVGHPIAQRLMGVIYYFGQGVPVDHRTSLIWFEKAANQGCFEAFAPTAQMYERGEGTPADPGKAYAWYNIAVAHLPQGREREDMIERREAVAAALTPAQLEGAQKRSLQFVARPVVPPDIADLPEDFFTQP